MVDKGYPSSDIKMTNTSHAIFLLKLATNKDFQMRVAHAFNVQMDRIHNDDNEELCI